MEQRKKGPWKQPVDYTKRLKVKLTPSFWLLDGVSLLLLAVQREEMEDSSGWTKTLVNTQWCTPMPCSIEAMGWHNKDCSSTVNWVFLLRHTHWLAHR